MPILENPRASVKPAAFSQHPRPAYPDRTEKGVPDAMGYSVRTAQVRFTEWRDWQTGKVIAQELYDEIRDPGEMQNVIETSRDRPALAEAKKLLEDMFPSNSPPAKR